MSKKTIQTLAKLARDVEIPIADVVEIAPKCSPRFSEKECCSIWKIPVPLSGVRVEACACRSEHAERFCRNGGAGVCRDWRAGTVCGAERCDWPAARAASSSGSLHTAGGGASDLYRNPAARDAAELLLSGYRGHLRGLHLICKLHRAGVCGIRHSSLSGSDAGRHPESVY